MNQHTNPPSILLLVLMNEETIRAVAIAFDLRR
jgi:hypothetical protein